MVRSRRWVEVDSWAATHAVRNRGWVTVAKLGGKPESALPWRAVLLSFGRRDWLPGLLPVVAASRVCCGVATYCIFVAGIAVTGLPLWVTTRAAFAKLSGMGREINPRSKRGERPHALHTRVSGANRCRVTENPLQEALSKALEERSVPSKRIRLDTSPQGAYC